MIAMIHFPERDSAVRMALVIDFARRGVRLGRALILIALVSLCGCNVLESYDSSRQQGTFAYLQYLSLHVEELIEEGGFDIEEVRRYVATVRDGQDSWGNEVMVFWLREGDEFSYVLVSPGRDGDLDYQDVEEYFTKGPEDVTGDYDRDIVFRDGEPIVYSSK